MIYFYRELEVEVIVSDNTTGLNETIFSKDDIIVPGNNFTFEWHH